MNSVLGALVGDAAGAVLEGLGPSQITEERVVQALFMPGGGRLRVGPGQVTDDGELTLALYSTLLKSEERAADIRLIASAYADWFDSMPFDMGGTCGNAFELFWSAKEGGLGERGLKEGLAKIVTEIEDINAFSEANGALMRVTGLIPWGLQRPLREVLNLAELDARLSHPNQVCVEVNKIYVYALYCLYRGYESRGKVIEELDRFVASQEIRSEVVKYWYFVESLDISGHNCWEQCGHVRHAFVLAMYFLRHPEISYKDAIYMTLLKGGDTDTNAAIVGGLVGSYNQIPLEMLKPVLEFDSKRGGRCHLRPDEYRPGKYFREGMAG